jgi:hypothetical protein
MNKCDSKDKNHEMQELIALWVPLALLSLIIMAAIFFSRSR